MYSNATDVFCTRCTNSARNLRANMRIKFRQETVAHLEIVAVRYLVKSSIEKRSRSKHVNKVWFTSEIFVIENLKDLLSLLPCDVAVVYKQRFTCARGSVRQHGTITVSSTSSQACWHAVRPLGEKTFSNLRMNVDFVQPLPNFIQPQSWPRLHK